MQLLYLDESGDPGWPPPYGKSQTEWFVLAGLSLEDNKWRSVNEQFVKIVRTNFGISYGNFDLKYSALTTKYPVPPYDKLNNVQKLQLADDILI